MLGFRMKPHRSWHRMLPSPLQCHEDRCHLRLVIREFGRTIFESVDALSNKLPKACDPSQRCFTSGPRLRRRLSISEGNIRVDVTASLPSRIDCLTLRAWSRNALIRPVRKSERLTRRATAAASSGVCFFPGFPGLSVSLLASLSDSLCCSESEDSEIRICEVTPATACVVSRVFILSPSQDLMHCTLSITVGLCTLCQKSKLHQHNMFFLAGHDPCTLACKAWPLFDGCRTSLSVSLSLSHPFNIHVKTTMPRV